MQEYIRKHTEYIGTQRNIMKYIRMYKAIKGRLSGLSLPGGWVHLAMFHIGPISHIYIYIYIQEYIGIQRKYIGIHRNMQEHIGKHREYIGIHRNIVKYIRICKAIRGRLSGFSLPGGWVHLAMFHIGPISHIYIYIGIYRN